MRRLRNIATGFAMNWKPRCVAREAREALVLLLASPALLAAFVIAAGSAVLHVPWHLIGEPIWVAMTTPPERYDEMRDRIRRKKATPNRPEGQE